MIKPLMITTLCAGLAACSPAVEFDQTAPPQNAPEIRGPMPYLTTTPANAALECVRAKRSKGQDLRIGVGEVTDGTGARTFTDGSSTLLSQRPDMMVAVALKKSGVRVMNRNATKVAEWELAQSMEQRLGEGRDEIIEGDSFSYRPVVAGSLIGTTHFITGALTEVNWNVNSTDERANIVGAFKESKEYSISVAIDLMVTNTKTTEIELARSYTKQIVGKEVSRGLFRFFEVDSNGVLGPLELFDYSSGEQRNEPLHRAVRWLVDVATYDITSTLTHTEKACASALAPKVVAPAKPVTIADAATTTAAVARPMVSKRD